MAVSLSTRTAYLNIVISLKDLKNERIENIKSLLKDYCDECFTTYAFILHDKDLLEDNTPKTPHIHLVGIYHTNRQRLSTILNDIACKLQVNNLAVSIDKMNDLNGSLQYLLHLNNPNKHRYEVTQITTNIELDELQIYLSRESKSISTSSLLDIVIHSACKIDVYNAIGLEFYRQYRQVINDLWFEVHEKDSIFACTQFMQNGGTK